MNVTVRKAEIKKGTDKNGKDYLFTSAFVVFDDKITAANVTIDHTVCHPDKIKPGVRAELYTSPGNKNRATIFDILGVKEEASADPFGVEDVNPENFDIDTLTGEAVEKNK